MRWFKKDRYKEQVNEQVILECGICSNRRVFEKSKDYKSTVENANKLVEEEMKNCPQLLISEGKVCWNCGAYIRGVEK